MEIKYIHDFNDCSEESFVKIQNELKDKIQLKNAFDLEKINICAGVDLAYWDKDGKNYAACSIIVMNYNTKEIIEKVYSVGEIKVPYIAGFLAFRELPLVLEAAEKISVEPDIFLFDGNGFLHYNNMGIATHASFFLNKPTIGIAKSYLKVNKVDFKMPKNEAGAFEDIIINGQVYGRAVITKKDVKPIFVSCGNYIDMESSYKIAMDLISKESKLPVPVRLADLETHVLRHNQRNN